MSLRDLIQIIQFCLKIHDWWRHPQLWVGGWLSGRLGWWMESYQITKNQINLDLIEIIEFCLKIYDLWGHPQLWVAVMGGGWMGGVIYGVMSNLQIYDLLRYLHAPTTNWSQSLATEIMSLIHSPTVRLLRIDMCITANFGLSFDIWLFT